MMRTETTIEWNGDEVKFRGRGATGKSTFEIGLAVQAQAKMLVPVVTHRLQGSITTQSGTQGTAVEAPATAADKIAGPSGGLDTYVGTNVEYGPYKEFGTVRSAAKPFLRPALDSVMGQAVSIVRKNAKTEFGGYLQ